MKINVEPLKMQEKYKERASAKPGGGLKEGEDETTGPCRLSHKTGYYFFQFVMTGLFIFQLLICISGILLSSTFQKDIQLFHFR